MSLNEIEIKISNPYLDISIIPFYWWLWIDIKLYPTTLNKVLYINVLCFHIHIYYWRYKRK